VGGDTQFTLHSRTLLLIQCYLRHLRLLTILATIDAHSD
jgi:hypothetical protein